MYDEYKLLINEVYVEIGYEGDVFIGMLEEVIDVLFDILELKGEMLLVCNLVIY